MNNELLSIIVPVYNVEKFFDACINSLVNQTYQNLEIILVDDGSIDNSYEICQKWQKKDDRIKLYHFEQSGGAVRARQKGLEMSSGNYVAYVDSDDWVEKEMFDVLMDAIIRNDADMAFSTGTCNEYEGGQVKSKDNIKQGIYQNEQLNQILYDMIHINVYPILWNRVFKKEQHLPWQMKTDERIRINNDITCMLMTIMHMNKVVAVDGYFYHYVKNNNSIVHTYRTEYLESNCLTYKLVKDEIISTGREFVLQDWKEFFLNKLFMNIRLECSTQNKVSFTTKMNRLKELYSNPILNDFFAENNSFHFSGREKIIWEFIQRKKTWQLYLVLKLYALKYMIFRVEE